MARILISFVGTGTVDNSGKHEQKFKSNREYLKAKYHIGNEDLGEYSFVAAALTKYHDIDKIILIGTTHSMWEEVYRYFCEQKGIETNEDIYLHIAEYCENSGHNSNLEIPHKEEIEKVLDGNSHVMLIKYGLTEEEIEENINIVLNLNKFINTGDEIIVDVTHSFRSLPIVIMNLLLYLTNVSNKKLQISHIYYGMLEMRHELMYAPIVDLKKILVLNKWIVGASEFKNYGNAYQIAELLHDVDSSISKELKDFSDVMNLNHLYKIEKDVEKFKNIKNKTFESLLPEFIVKPIIEDFLKRFRTTQNNHALFQYRIAKWQFENMNYALSLISLSESIITYACQKSGEDWSDKEVRKKIKHETFHFLPQKLATCYNKLRIYRNAVAHSIRTDNSPKAVIDYLRKALDLTKDFIDQ